MYSLHVVLWKSCNVFAGITGSGCISYHLPDALCCRYSWVTWVHMAQLVAQWVGARVEHNYLRL